MARASPALEGIDEGHLWRAFDTAVEDLKERADGWYNAMAKSSKSIDEHKKAEDEWAVTTGKVKDVIEGVRQKMMEAQKAEGEFTDVIRDNKAAHRGPGEGQKHASRRGEGRRPSP
jgi:uncharacterized coiled-coil DUF342 family protein